MINLSFTAYDVDDAANALFNMSSLTVEGGMFNDGSDDNSFGSKLTIGHRIANRYHEKFGVRIDITRSPGAYPNGLVVLHNTRPGVNLQEE